MATKKKLLQAAAGTAAAGGAGGLNVEEVFSTYLYDGTGDNQTNTVTNGIDLSGEGGMVWTKSRNLTFSPIIFDSERGLQTFLYTNQTQGETNQDARSNMSFNSDGYSFGSTSANSWGPINEGIGEFASWTFRKAPKFFDVVTYTGNGVTTGRTISHNLGGTVGTLIVKRTDSTSTWAVWHRTFSNTGLIYLNETYTVQPSNTGFFYSTSPTSTEFTVGEFMNASGATYVAYLFAHNDGDGDFGPTGDQDIIKCGSYTGNGSTDGPEIDLGFEPQWLMIKSASSSSWNWMMVDSMRGCPVDGAESFLLANTSGAEQSPSTITGINLTPTGFNIADDYGAYNTSGDTYIYIAIRRGPMAVPTAGTDIYYYATQDSSSPGHEAPVANWPVDFAIKTKTSGADNRTVATRLLGQNYLLTNSTAAEASSADITFDYQNGLYESTAAYSDRFAWMFRRGYKAIDAVAYTGNGTAGRTVSHNLGVAPEMMWVKKRSGTGNWSVYHSGLGADFGLFLDLTNGAINNASYWNDTSPTATDFTLGSGSTGNDPSADYIAYLFASLDGVSKVFSATKSSGSDASVNCGFSAGPRFVLLKRTDSTGDWYVWDSERGIVSGNDPYLLLNSTAAEVTSTDYIDPTSNGFTIVNGGLADGDYIGYAIA